MQDSILHCVREESIQKKKLRSLKQKSLDIGNADSLLFTLDEHRRKSCIDRCDTDRPPHAAYVMQRQHGHGHPRQNSATRPDSTDVPENPATEGFQETRRPVIPEVRLNCMETFEVKVDSPLKPAPKEDLDRSCLHRAASPDCHRPHMPLLCTLKGLTIRMAPRAPSTGCPVKVTVF